jgi:hypothetical protein
MKFLDNTKIPDHPYPELREVLNIFVEEIAAELGENLIGIYLVGSIASGDFDADSTVQSKKAGMQWAKQDPFLDAEKRGFSLNQKTLRGLRWSARFAVSVPI